MQHFYITSIPRILRACDCSISLLSGCIPNLCLNFSTISKSHGTCCKLHTDSWDIIPWQCSLYISKNAECYNGALCKWIMAIAICNNAYFYLPVEEMGFTDTSVSNKDNQRFKMGFRGCKIAEYGYLCRDGCNLPRQGYYAAYICEGNYEKNREVWCAYLKK